MGKLLIVVRTALMVAYPVAVYVGLTRFSARAVGLLLLVLLLPSLVRTLLSAPRGELRGVLPVPLITLGLITLSATLNDQRFILALPVLISLTFLYGFTSSLRGVPMVERFARLQDGDLSPEKVRYCRSVTKVWSVFFAINAAIAATLALLAPLSAWALYCGLIAYILIGTLAGTEYTIRKYRFRDYSDRFHDRLLSRLFPPTAVTHLATRGQGPGEGS